MIVANSQLVPEFQYYFNKFVRNSIVNRYGIPLPVAVDEKFLAKGTVVELLCSEQFPYNEYTYFYKNESRTNCWPTLTRQRLMIYPGSQYLVPSTESDGGINIFNLQAHDFMMLDVLLSYRHDSTSVTVIDSTSLQIITDATSGITTVYASVDVLITSLSKLIYLYLQFKINQNYELYNNTEIISDCSLLATCFELSLIDQYFLYMQSRVMRFNIDCDVD